MGGKVVVVVGGVRNVLWWEVAYISRYRVCVWGGGGGGGIFPLADVSPYPEQNLSLSYIPSRNELVPLPSKKNKKKHL